MILSVSRRTDIPAFFPRWFLGRLRDGYALARNPMNHRQVSRIDLSPKTIDGIVFWTKNPAPMLPYLDEIGALSPFYFQYTLNAYGVDVEENVPPLAVRLRTLEALARTIGQARIVWRYDPVFLSPAYGANWHVEAFGRLAREIAPFAESCTFSFLDVYPKIGNNLRLLQGRAPSHAEMRMLGAGFAAEGKKYGLPLSTCAETIDLSACGVRRGRCIDPERIGELSGREIRAAKDKNQRPACGCAESVDIGAYNTCLHHCRYCYANFSSAATAARVARHDENAPMLVGRLEAGDKVTERKARRSQEKKSDPGQGALFA